MSQDPSRLINEVVSVGDLDRMHKNKKYHDLNHYRLNGRELVMALLATTETPVGDRTGTPNTSLIFSAAQRILWQETEIARLTKEVKLRSSDAWRAEEPELLALVDGVSTIRKAWLDWYMFKNQVDLPEALSAATHTYALTILDLQQNAGNRILIDAVAGFKVYLVKLKNDPWVFADVHGDTLSNVVNDDWMEEYCAARNVGWGVALAIGANAVADKMITGTDRDYELTVQFSPERTTMFHFQIQRHYYEGAPYAPGAYLRDDQEEKPRQ